MICNYVFQIFNLEDKVVFEGDSVISVIQFVISVIKLFEGC